MPWFFVVLFILLLLQLLHFVSMYGITGIFREA
jgi:hypothetical protein